jgi:hypothetical protein
VLVDSLSSAFDRLDDFVEVQGPQLTPESVDLLQAAAGVTERERRVVRDRVLALERPGTSAHRGAAGRLRHADAIVRKPVGPATDGPWLC